MIISEKQILTKRLLSKTGDLTINGCKEFLGALRPDGYGQLTMKGKNYSAHRLSWMIENGDIPKGLCVLHKCDNPSCVNPDHLFLGTHKDNTADMMNKRRGFFKHGEGNYCAKLTGSDVKEIFPLSGMLSQRELAKKFDVTQGLIASILNHHSWKSVSASLKSMSGIGEGSSQKGSKASRAKLSEDQALYIFNMKGHKSRYELAEEFDVAEVTIRKIWGKQTWRHVTC